MTYHAFDFHTANLASEVDAETRHIQQQYARFGEALFDPDFPYDSGVPFEDTQEDEAFWETLYAD